MTAPRIGTFLCVYAAAKFLRRFSFSKTHTWSLYESGSQTSSGILVIPQNAAMIFCLLRNFCIMN